MYLFNFVDKIRVIAMRLAIYRVMTLLRFKIQFSSGARVTVLLPTVKAQTERKSHIHF